MKYIKTMIAVSMACLAGCTNWLDVKPVDRVTEEELYSTETGFMLALNGIYVELNKADLYGGELLYNTVEILAQRYDFPSIGSLANQYKLEQFDYNTDYAKNKSKIIWEKAYSLISNVNKLLENADKRKELFTGDHYRWITGEALALRAFLHFDLLRLYGPVYKTDKDKKSICYNLAFSLSGSDLLPASQVIDYVVKDLKEAEKRLEADPIIEQGPLSSDREGEDNDWRYRTLRLNYYAVKALQARVYLYAGMNGEALEAARAVTAVQEKWFPFTKYTSIVGNTKSPDRVFSSELLFCLQNPKRGDIFTNSFSPDLTNEQLYAPKAMLDEVFGRTKDADWRYASTWIMPANHDFRCFHKYEKVESAGFFSNLIPLIRMSEMFYIIAETATDEEEALKSINLVLENRGVEKLENTEQLEEMIRTEYQREFWGEGQLFFYYKRINASVVPSAISSVDVAMDASKYVLPLPDSEVDFR